MKLYHNLYCESSANPCLSMAYSVTNEFSSVGSMAIRSLALFIFSSGRVRVMISAFFLRVGRGGLDLLAGRVGAGVKKSRPVHHWSLSVYVCLCCVCMCL